MSQLEAVTPVTCEICGKAFYTRRALRIHHGQVHKNGSDRPNGFRLKPVTFKLTDQQYQQLKELSKIRKESISILVRRAVSQLVVEELKMLQRREENEPEAIPG